VPFWSAKVIDGKESEGAKFQDYFAHQERLSNVPSHRALAMLRGRNEGILQLSLNADPEQDESIRQSYCEEIIRQHLGVQFNQQPADSWRQQVISWTWRIKVVATSGNRIDDGICVKRQKPKRLMCLRAT
jgi:uncharacterized protein